MTVVELIDDHGVQKVDELYVACLATLNNMIIAPAANEVLRLTRLIFDHPIIWNSAHSTSMSRHSAQHASHLPCHSTQRTPFSLSLSDHNSIPPLSIVAHVDRSSSSSSHGLPRSTDVAGVSMGNSSTDGK
ncbi:hypothetical protein Scep_010022 [Stephania cephalantha]|uniref:Uncharacterized protein n=1 Tax=Stephania cephalantha TaxID=152367 RepID=A0AAP0JUN7_9MAGN